MEPTIAVVIPLYNKAKHIADTLESVLAQYRLPDEIIVVDDGSTDLGASIVRQFNSRGVLLLQQPNMGVSAARNTGVHAVRSTYVAFLDADDIWASNHLATLELLIRKFPDAGFFSTMHEIRLEGKRFVPHSAFRSGEFVRVQDFCRSMALGLSLVNSSTACVRTDAIRLIGGFPQGVKRGEDIVVWIRLAWEFGMAHAGEITAIYNRDAVNRSNLIPEIEPPESLRFLAKALAMPVSLANERLSCGLLFDRIAFYTAAGIKERGSCAGIPEIMKLAASSKRWRVFVLLSILLLVPPFLLSFARNYRHKGVGG